MLSSVSVLLPLHFVLASAQAGTLITQASVGAVTPSQLETELTPSLDLDNSASRVIAALTPTPIANLKRADRAQGLAPAATDLATSVDAIDPIPTAASAAAAKPVPRVVMSEQTVGTTEVEAEVDVAVPVAVVPMLEPDLWTRVRSGYSLPEYNSKLVRQYEKFFSNNPRYLGRVIERGRLYLPYVVKQLEYRGMPTELALLPIVESAYNPQAVSKAKAVGMWQFISSTGLRYGLRQDRWYEGRRDIMDSTQAALNYLSFLHQELDGDWLVAIAAYNGGEHRMLREKKRLRKAGKAETFDNIKMKRETRHYVPKLIALSNIFANPEKFGVVLPDVSYQPSFKVVWTEGAVNLKTAARLAGMKYASFKALNPAFKRRLTPPSQRARLLLPFDAADRLTSALANRDHTVANRGRLVRTSNQRKRASGGHTKIVHRVRRGDTLSGIAQRYSVYTDEVAAWNAMDLSDVLQLGRRLVIYQ